MGARAKMGESGHFRSQRAPHCMGSLSNRISTSSQMSWQPLAWWGGVGWSWGCVGTGSGLAMREMCQGSGVLSLSEASGVGAGHDHVISCCTPSPYQHVTFHLFQTKDQHGFCVSFRNGAPVKAECCVSASP